MKLLIKVACSKMYLVKSLWCAIDQLLKNEKKKSLSGALEGQSELGLE